MGLCASSSAAYATGSAGNVNAREDSPPGGSAATGGRSKALPATSTGSGTQKPAMENLSTVDSSKSADKHFSPPAAQMSVLTWRKGALIGQGGVGKVYLALQPDTGALFAVKEVDLSKMDASAVRDIRAEITALK
jgi:serine/threonine protein kinase